VFFFFFFEVPRILPNSNEAYRYRKEKIIGLDRSRPITLQDQKCHAHTHNPEDSKERGDLGRDLGEARAGRRVLTPAHLHHVNQNGLGLIIAVIIRDVGPEAAANI